MALPTVATQRSSIESVLSDIELEMVAVSDDLVKFNQLRQRRARLQDELGRLVYREKAEQIESEEAHRQALRDRLTDARARAAEAAAELKELNTGMADAVQQIIAAGAAFVLLERRFERLARQEDVALDSLRRAGIAVAEPRPTISYACLPREVVVQLYAASAAILGATRLGPASPAVQSAVQRFKLNPPTE